VTTKPIANSAINALCKRELLYPTAYWKSMFPLEYSDDIEPSVRTLRATHSEKTEPPIPI